MEPNPSRPRYKAASQSPDDPFDFILSDETPDRDGDIVRAKGWQLEEFKANPIALFGHAHDKIVGVWTNVRTQGKQLIGRLKLAEEGTSELVDVTRRLVEQRILKAVSVGFMPIEYEPMTKGGWDIKRAQLFEASLVAVPANPSALALAKAFSPHPDVVDQLLVRPDAADPHSLDPLGRTADEIKTPKLDRLKKELAEMNIY